MARQRMVRPELWTREEFLTLTLPARLLYIGMQNFADDRGVIKYSPVEIKARIFPVEGLNVGELAGELVREGLVEKFKSGGKEWLWIKDFLKMQKIRHPQPTDNPPPPGEEDSPDSFSTDNAKVVAKAQPVVKEREKAAGRELSVPDAPEKSVEEAAFNEKKLKNPSGEDHSIVARGEDIHPSCGPLPEKVEPLPKIDGSLPLPFSQINLNISKYNNKQMDNPKSKNITPPVKRENDRATSRDRDKCCCSPVYSNVPGVFKRDVTDRVRKGVPLFEAEKAQAVKTLKKIGVGEKAAVELTNKYGPHQVLRQAAWLPRRKLDNPPGGVIRAIEENWEPPPDLEIAESKRVAAKCAAKNQGCTWGREPVCRFCPNKEKNKKDKSS